MIGKMFHTLKFISSEYYRIILVSGLIIGLTIAAAGLDDIIGGKLSWFYFPVPFIYGFLLGSGCAFCYSLYEVTCIEKIYKEGLLQLKRSTAALLSVGLMVSYVMMLLVSLFYLME